MNEEQYQERVTELVAELKASLEHSIHVLSGILEDVNKGEYTQEKAQIDYELMMFNDGIDFMSIVGDLANIGKY